MTWNYHQELKERHHRRQYLHITIIWRRIIECCYIHQKTRKSKPGGDGIVNVLPQSIHDDIQLLKPTNTTPLHPRRIYDDLTRSLHSQSIFQVVNSSRQDRSWGQTNKVFSTYPMSDRASYKIIWWCTMILKQCNAKTTLTRQHQTRRWIYKIFWTPRTQSWCVLTIDLLTNPTAGAAHVDSMNNGHFTRRNQCVFYELQPQTGIWILWMQTHTPLPQASTYCPIVNDEFRLLRASHTLQRPCSIMEWNLVQIRIAL